MAYQTSVSHSPAVAVEGMLAYGTQHGQVPESGYNTVAAGMKPGRLVVQKAATVKGLEHPNAAGEITGPRILGVTIYVASREPDPDGYMWAVNEMVPYLRKGYIWVLAEDAVTAGVAAFVRHVAGAGEELGRFRSDADGGGPDATAHAGLVWRSTTTGANQLALLEVNLPGVAS